MVDHYPLLEFPWILQEKLNVHNDNHDRINVCSLVALCYVALAPPPRHHYDCGAFIFSKLLENHKIGSTEFKLWRLNESTNQLIKRGTCTCSTYLHINLYYSHTLTLLGGWLFDSQWYYGPPLYLLPHDLCPLTLVTSSEQQDPGVQGDDWRIVFRGSGWFRGRLPHRYLTPAGGRGLIISTRIIRSTNKLLLVATYM